MVVVLVPHLASMPASIAHTTRLATSRLMPNPFAPRPPIPLACPCLTLLVLMGLECLVVEMVESEAHTVMRLPSFPKMQGPVSRITAALLAVAIT